MPISYSILVGAKTVAGSIKSWRNYSKVDAEGVLEDAQAYLFQEMRVREMRAAAPLSVTLGASTAALPTGFLDAYGSIRDLTHTTRLDLRSEDDLEDARYYDTTGTLQSGDPCLFGIYGEAIQFDVASREAWAGRMLYYKSPTLLSGGNDTNFLTTRYPHILRAVCLAFAAVFENENEDYARDLQRATAMIEQANAMDDLSRRGEVGGPEDRWDG